MQESSGRRLLYGLGAVFMFLVAMIIWNDSSSGRSQSTFKKTASPMAFSVSKALKTAKLLLHGTAQSPTSDHDGSIRMSQLGSKTAGHNMFNQVDYPDVSAERNYAGNDIFHQGHGGGFSNDGVAPGPGGTTGAFSGHSMGSKGGPLTLGAGTYFDVFNPGGDSDAGGPCDPGTHGMPGECEECEVGKWCPGQPEGGEPADIVHECPDKTKTREKGAYTVADCICKPGWWGGPRPGMKGRSENRWLMAGCPQDPAAVDPELADPTQALGAVECCDGDNLVTRQGCLSGSGADVSPVSFFAAKALCEGKGWRLCRREELNTPDGGGACGSGCGYDAKQVWAELGCTMCVADFYCPGGTETYACPEHSSSLQEATICTCDAGYYGPMESCQQCEAGSYCVGGLTDLEKQKYACPSYSSSPAGSGTSAACQCNPGFYEPLPRGTDGLPDCVPCPEDSYCPGGASSVACPANAQSPAQSVGEQDCACAPGFYVNGGGCAQCPAGNFCSGGYSITACPANSNAPAGSVDVSDCSCGAGFAGFPPSACVECPKGYTCPGDGLVYSTVDNEALECWSPCGGKQGPCAWCGKGLCCRKGWSDFTNGCDGTIGSDPTRHVCAKGHGMAIGDVESGDDDNGGGGGNDGGGNDGDNGGGGGGEGGSDEDDKEDKDNDEGSTWQDCEAIGGKFGRGYGGAGGGGVCCKAGCKRCGGGDDGDKSENWCKNQNVPGKGQGWINNQCCKRRTALPWCKDIAPGLPGGLPMCKCKPDGKCRKSDI